MKQLPLVVMWEIGTMPYYFAKGEHLGAINSVFRYMGDITKLHPEGKERVFYVPERLRGELWKLVL
jgi:hypothetical protein